MPILYIFSVAWEELEARQHLSAPTLENTGRWQGHICEPIVMSNPVLMLTGDITLHTREDKQTFTKSKSKHAVPKIYWNPYI